MTLSEIFQNVVKLLVKYKSAYISGILMTIKLSVVTVFFGMIIGSLIALLKLSELHIGKIKPLNILATPTPSLAQGGQVLLSVRPVIL